MATGATLSQNEINIILKMLGLSEVEGGLNRLNSGLNKTHRTVTHLNTAMTRVNSTLGKVGVVSGLASQFTAMGGAASTAAVAITGVASALELVGKSKVGLIGIAATLATIAAVAGFSFLEKRRLVDPAIAGLGEGIERRTDAIANKVASLGRNSLLTAGQVESYLNQLERIKTMKPEEAHDALGKALEAVKKQAKENFDAQKQLAAVEVESAQFTHERLGTLESLQALENKIAEQRKIHTIAEKEGLIAGHEHAKAFLEEQKGLLEVEKERRNLLQDPRERQINQQMDADTEAHRGSVPGQLGDSFRELQTQFGTTAEIIARGFRDTIGSAVDGIAGSIRGLLTLTMTWGEALRNIGISIVNGIINAFANMVAEWIMAHVIMKGVLLAFSLFGITLKAKEATATSAIEATKTPLLAVNAGLASTSSYGAAAAVGLVTVLALIAALAATSFAVGGYTGPGGKYQPAGVVHRGEFVMDAASTARIGVPRLEAMRKGEAMMPEGGSQKITVVNVWSQAEARNIILNSQEGERIIVSTIQKNEHNL